MGISIKSIGALLGFQFDNPPERTTQAQIVEESSSQIDDTGFANKQRGAKIYDIATARGESAPLPHENVIYLIRSSNDCQGVIDDMLKGRTIIINLEVLKLPERQRVIDMLSGATYAEGAVIKKVSPTIYCLAPKGVTLLVASPPGQTQQSLSDIDYEDQHD